MTSGFFQIVEIPDKVTADLPSHVWLAIFAIYPLWHVVRKKNGPEIRKIYGNTVFHCDHSPHQSVGKTVFHHSPDFFHVTVN
jgi:hypothetical protein